MNKNDVAFQLGIVRICLCCLLGIFSSFGYAESTIQSLLDDDKLAIKVWLDPSEDIIATQQVNLNIEVSTHRWFVGGTQLGRLEVDNAIVLSRDSFAVNSSRRTKGENWAVQLWTMTLYPQRSGQFKVPSIPVNVTVSGEDNQPVKGEIYTEELTFSAVEPAETKDIKGWIATPLFEVEDTFDKNIAELKKGDSVQRTIRFKAENIAAMMLPEFNASEMDGVGVYPKPASIEDTVNRGDYLAERTDVVNYVIEQSGDYRLPALTFYWWDLNAQALQTVEIPEQILSTSGSAEPVAAERQLTAKSFGDKVKKALPFIVMLVVLLLVMGSAIVIRKRRKKQKADKREAPKALEAKFVKACQQQQYFVAVALLYQWFDYRALEVSGDLAVGSVRKWLKGLDDRELIEQLNQLMSVACSDTSTQHNGAVSQSSIVKVDFNLLLKRLQSQSSASHSLVPFAKPIDLRLN